MLQTHTAVTVWRWRLKYGGRPKWDDERKTRRKINHCHHHRCSVVTFVYSNDFVYWCLESWRTTNQNHFFRLYFALFRARIRQPTATAAAIRGNGTQRYIAKCVVVVNDIREKPHPNSSLQDDERNTLQMKHTSYENWSRAYSSRQPIVASIPKRVTLSLSIQTRN